MVMCVCASMRPGITHSFERSMILAPDGTAPPTDAILPSWITITWFLLTFPVAGSMRLPARMAMSCAAASVQKIVKTKKDWMVRISFSRTAVCICRRSDERDRIQAALPEGKSSASRGQERRHGPHGFARLTNEKEDPRKSALIRGE